MTRTAVVTVLAMLLGCGSPAPAAKAGSVEIANRTDKVLFRFLVLINGANPGLDLAGVGEGASSTFGFFPGPALQGHAVITFHLAVPDTDYEASPSFRYECDITAAALSDPALDTVSFQIAADSCRIVGHDKVDAELWVIPCTPATPPAAEVTPPAEPMQPSSP